jgi:hypothetical protein
MTPLKELQNYTFISKYARWLPEEKRRETWREAVDRVRGMMLDKYADCDISDEINWAYDMMYEKKVLGSQRNLQFGGDAVLKKMTRSFNCSSSYCNRLRFFAECMWVLLCGCGTGFSVQKHHINKLPKFSKKRLRKEKLPSKIFQIQDTIESWSNSISVLLTSYFEIPADDEFSSFLNSEVEFDYSKIRPKGSPLSSSSGVAPGSDPLRKTLENIRKLLDRCIENNQNKLRAVDAYDCVMYLADAVLSGGVRRSATICLFSLDDQEMMETKIGNWQEENPQRARSNNSVVLLRNEITFEEFQQIIERTKEYGEPGFYWVDDLESLSNPCQPKEATVLTSNGIRTIEDIKIGDKIWSEEGWTNVINKACTGKKEVYAYQTTAGVFIGTKNHHLIQKGEKIPAKECESIDTLRGKWLEDLPHIKIIPEIVMDGLVIGDGITGREKEKAIYLCIGEKDEDYFKSEIAHLILYKQPASKYVYKVKTGLLHQEIPKTYLRYIPKRYIYGDLNEIVSFLRGLYSANGSVIVNYKVAIKASSFEIIKNVQLMLSALGIASYYTTNKPTTIEFKNGKYDIKQSYDLHITTDIKKFYHYIGFLQKYKMESLKQAIENKKRWHRAKINYDIKTIHFLGTHNVYSITVNNKSHTYWTEGLNVANCNEIGMYAYDEFGNSGWSFCNLSTINCGSLRDKEDFYERCKAAAIIGTLQAGFDQFDYLGEITENIVKREALLGVSMTGMMDNTDIVLDKRVQRKGAEIIKKINKEIAEKIGINQAARLTCIKPEGTTSCLLGTSSGIHPMHAKRYIRRIQNNTTEEPYKFFKERNGCATEKSVWGRTSKDENILFPIEIPDGSKTKNQISAIEMLETVKLTQQNWIAYGKNEELCVQPWLSHSVSNTVVVKNEEWQDVTKYIYKNRQHFAGVTLMSYRGDKDYPQSPFSTILTSREIIREYGECAIWCSGLIELCLEAFDGNLWEGCRCILMDDFGESVMKNGFKPRSKEFKKYAQQTEVWERCRKFADKYLSGDYKKLTYALKDVYNWKLYTDLVRTFQPVDYSEMVEDKDNTKLEETVACAGGKCEI